MKLGTAKRCTLPEGPSMLRGYAFRKELSRGVEEPVELGVMALSEGEGKEDFNKKVDACVIDPPRKGCSEFAIETLLRLSPEKIVYVSCNPDTLARDLTKLGEKYKISSPVTPFNMFPRRAHIESVVCLTRSDKAT